MSDLRERISRGDILIMDGGVSTEIERKGVSMDANVWSGVDDQWGWAVDPAPTEEPDTSRRRSEFAAHLERDIFAVASHTCFDYVGGHYEFEARACHAAEALVLENSDNENTVANLFHDPDMLIDIGFEPAMVLMYKLGRA